MRRAHAYVCALDGRADWSNGSEPTLVLSRRAAHCHHAALYADGRAAALEALHDGARRSTSAHE